jgi:hypothetical protein
MKNWKTGLVIAILIAIALFLAIFIPPYIQVRRLAETQYRQRQSQMQFAIGQMLGFVGIYCQFHEGKYPKDVDELIGVAKDYPGDPNPNIKWPGDIGFNAIEFVGSDSENLNGNSDSRKLHNKIIIREATSRRTPNGKCERIYGFADQHTEIAISNSEDFSLWEKKRRASKANQ